MKAISTLLATVVALLMQAWFVASAAPANESFALTFETVQVAGIDGREWDKRFPGAMTVDAVHRAVLLRFPSTAEGIKRQIDTGLSVERLELVLSFDGTEIAPEGYLSRTGLGEKKWRENPPQWHVVAWALRRPWMTDRDRGPTFNAYVNGAGYWAKYGAS